MNNFQVSHCGSRCKKDMAEIERMLKALINSLENKHLSPGTLEPLDPLLQLNWRRTLYFKIKIVRGIELKRMDARLVLLSNTTS